VKLGLGFQHGNLGMAGSGVAASFTPASIAGLTLWLDATSLTQNLGLVSAITNKGSTAVDPTITAGEEPTYTASNANYNNRPTWKCVSGGGTKVIRAAAACHGLGAGARTVVVVGQCGDANYAMGSTSGLSLIAGGGGSGNKWQGTDQAGPWLVSSGLTNTPSVLVFVFDGASSRIYANARTAVSGDAGALENLSALALMLGNNGAPSSALGANGDTTHFLAYNAALSNADCGTLLDYLGAQAGITIGA
jgi:hypothetical protein